MKTYLRIIYFAVMMLALLAFGYYFSHEVYLKYTPISKPFLKNLIIISIVGGFVFFLIMGFLINELSSFLNVTHPVRIANNGIRIGNRDYHFSEIKQIKTIDLNRIKLECFYGASILFTNDETAFIIGEKFYKEDALLFQELENIQKEHLCLTVENDNTIKGTDSTGEQSFDFNIFSSILFLFFLAITSLFALNIFQNSLSIGLTCFSIALSIALYALTARETYYFIVSDRGLQIRNKLYFGYSKTFLFNDIKGVTIYQKGLEKASRQGIRIITNDYHSIFFASNPLPLKKWAALGETLRDAGVGVVSQWEKTGSNF